MKHLFPDKPARQEYRDYVLEMIDVATPPKPVLDFFEMQKEAKRKREEDAEKKKNGWT